MFPADLMTLSEDRTQRTYLYYIIRPGPNFCRNFFQLSENQRSYFWNFLLRNLIWSWYFCHIPTPIKKTKHNLKLLFFQVRTSITPFLQLS